MKFFSSDKEFLAAVRNALFGCGSAALCFKLVVAPKYLRQCALDSVPAMYLTAAIIVLGLHLAFILWVVFGAIFTQRRPLLRRLHIASLAWGLLIEIFPWTCPLTSAENWLEQRAGTVPYEGGFLLHYLDALVYPDVPQQLLVVVAVVVAAANVAVYWRRWRRPAL